MSQRGQNPPDEMTWYQKLVHLNPARWIALVTALLFVLGSFGLVVTGEQKEGLVSLLLAIVPILQGVWTESKTTADNKVVVVAPDPIAQPTLVEPGKATTDAKVVDILNAAQNTPNSWESRS